MFLQHRPHPWLFPLWHRLLHPLVVELFPPRPPVGPPPPDPSPWLLLEPVPPEGEAHHPHRHLALPLQPPDPRFLLCCRIRSTLLRPLL